MRVLFILKQMGYVRHFDTVVQALAAKGHSVRVAGQDGMPLPESLARLPHVFGTACPKRRADGWGDYASLVRRAADYLRYLDPPYDEATKLRARAFEKFISTLSAGQRVPDRGWSEVGRGLTPAERTRLHGLFEMLEGTLPSDPHIEHFLREQAPDLMLITPLIDLGSGQTDFVKSAAALGIPSVMVLFSWDNLSTKGGIHTHPDRLLVWNARQQREAVELHGVDPERIVITGAPRFDTFFATSAATDRQSFCEALGLDPSRPILVYLGSSRFVSEDERPFIAEWIGRVRRSSDPLLAAANIVVKAHPDLNRDWEAPDERHVVWETMPGTRVLRTTPFADERVVVVRSTFTSAPFLYDCLHHSAAVVGLNTSAEIEAGILGKPVCTIAVDDSKADGQTSTLHFHYLLEENGGFVRIAANLDDHLNQLSEVLAGKYDSEAIHSFIRDFVRPAGLDRPATDVFIEAVENCRRAAKRGRRAIARQLAAVANDAGPAEGGPRTNVRREPSEAGAEGAASANRVLLDYEPAPIWLHVTSEPERKWRVRTCAKEPWTVAWIEAQIREGDVFYDIGANIGAFSLIAARRCRNNLTVVAFEPGYATFAHLCDNIVLNGCDRSIIPVPLPLSGSTGLAGFKYRSLHPGQSRHSLVESRLRRQKDKLEPRYLQPVLAVRLDDLVKQFGLPLPSHIKLDVDGAELRVLEGASDTLDHAGLKTILLEIDQTLGEAISSQLSRKGFALVQKHVREHKPDAPWYGVFERR